MVTIFYRGNILLTAPPTQKDAELVHLIQQAAAKHEAEGRPLSNQGMD